ncbi:MAG TPA: HEAT repeat domain-containing protein [Vicinamibacterales bacterium]|nr:HEAT repeat domain-containing protein [Vicinamibacterales bacterium]
MTVWTVGTAVLALTAWPAAAQTAATAAQAAQNAERAAMSAHRDVQMALARASGALASAGLGDADMAMARAAEALAMPFQDRDRDREQAERARELAERDRERADREREQQNRYYDAGREALDNARWETAVSNFDRVIDMKGTRADAALYFKAYAQNRAGQRADALNTIGVLKRDYPKSRYLEQAKALEVEVRSEAGQPVHPESQSDEELKLLAIQALQNSDPEQAIPMLQKILQGTGSPKLKERALFVLAQSDSPKARDVLVNIAKGTGATPDMQMKAIQYLGIHGGSESRAALADIYRSTADVDVKRRILRAFMVAGEKDRLLSVAQTEQNPDLRGEAVRQLGVMGATDELMTMYQKESSIDVKKQILQAMFTGGNATRMIDLARSEQNPELRRIAVRNLGLMGGRQTGAALAEIYSTDKDPAIRGAVIQALFIQNNAESLVALARKEQDPAMKKDIVQKLSLMHSKVATDYLLEILNK